MSVSDFSWQGENIFELFYYRFLQDCKNKEQVVALLMKNQFPPERLTTHTGYKKGTLIYRIALAMLKKFSRELQRRNKEQLNSAQEELPLELN